jgi:voltage-gated potassium channel
MHRDRHRYRFWILLGTLALLIAAGPILRAIRGEHASRLLQFAGDVLFLIMLLSGVYAVAQRRASIVVALVLLALYAVPWAINLGARSTALRVLCDVLAMGFVAWAIFVLLANLFRVTRVTGDTIAASMCVYLFVAVLWAEAYSIIAILDEAAFSTPLLPVGSEALGRSDDPSVLYFSLVTMTTLGYGDVVPNAGYVRILAAMEAVTGQLYIAVLVARLVGLHIAQSKRV